MDADNPAAAIFGVMANALVDFVSDPRYAKLNDAQRLDAFGELEPEFRNLKPDAQRDFITRFEAKYRTPVGAEKTGLPPVPKMQAEPEYVSPGVDLREGKRKNTITEDIAQSYKGTIGEAIAPEAARKTADVTARFVGATGEGMAGIVTGLGNILHALGTVADSDALRYAGGGLASVGKTVEREFKPEKTGGEGVMGQLPEIAGSAIGSMMGFRAAGKLVGKAVEAVAGTGKAGAIANWLATSAVETGTTAGGVYADELEAGKDPRQAAGSAGKFAAFSGPATAILNKLGQFNDRIRNPILKTVAEMGGEIAQEDSEQITQNMVTGKPWNQGLPESTVGAVFGSLIGGAAFEHAAVTGIVNDYHEAVREHGANPETARELMERRLTEEAPNTAAMVTTAADEKFDPFTEISGVLRESAKNRDAAVEEFLAEHPEYRDEVLGPPEAPDAGAVAPRDEDVPGEIRSQEGATADAPVEGAVEALPVEASAQPLAAAETDLRTSGSSEDQGAELGGRSADSFSPQPDTRTGGAVQEVPAPFSPIKSGYRNGKPEVRPLQPVKQGGGEVIPFAPKANRTEDAIAENKAEAESEDASEDVYRQAVDLVQAEGKASTSFLQRRLRIGYGKATRLLDRMSADGIVEPANGSEPRAVLSRGTAPPAATVNQGSTVDLRSESTEQTKKPEAAETKPVKKLAEVAAEVEPTLPKLKQRPFAQAVEAHGRWEAKLLAAHAAGKSTAFIGKMVDKHAAVLRKGLGENYSGPLTAEEILQDAKIAAEKEAKRQQPVKTPVTEPRQQPLAKPAEVKKKAKASDQLPADSIPRPPTEAEVRDPQRQRQQKAQKIRDRFATVWEVPPDVWADAAGEFDGNGRKRLLAKHRETVEQAVAAGKPVPAAVLKAHGIPAAPVRAVEKPVEKTESPAKSIPRPPSEAEVRRLPKLPRPRGKKAIAEADAKAHAEQMGLAGGFYTSYGGGVDEILAVEEGPLSGGYTYTVRNTKSGEVRKHSTRIDPRAVVFREEGANTAGEQKDKSSQRGFVSADLLASPVLRGVELLSSGVRTFREWKARLVEEYGPSIKHKAYSLWAAAKRLWNDETGTLRLDKLAEWYRDSVAHSLGEVVKPIRRRIAEAGDGAGRDLMRLLDKAGNEGEVLAGMLLVKLRDVELHKLNREQRFELLDVLEGRVSPDKLSDRMREVYTAARSVGDELAVIADDLDVMVTSKDGKRKFQARADYFPHVIRTPETLKKGPVRRDVIENLVRIKEAENVEQATVMLDNFIKGVESGRWDNRMLEYLIRTGQADSRAKALAMLQRYRSHVHRHGTLEHAREVNLPFYDPDPARVLPWVTSTSAIRLAQIAEFGQDHRRINAEILKIRDAGGDADFVRNQVDKILGLVMAEDDAEKRLSLWLRTLMSFKLGLAQIPNATQGLLNTMLAGDFPAVAAGVRGMLTKRGRRLAIESGAAIDPVLAEAARDLGEKRMIDAFLKWTGFSAAEQMNRVFAANAGADLAGRLVQRLAKMPEAKRSKSWEWKRLEDLGIDPALAAARGKLNHGEMLMAAKVFSDMTQFRTRVQDQPSLAKYKVMWQFKSFAYNQGRLIAQEVVGEWRRGHPGRAMRAMLVMALFFPLVGDLVRALRDLIRGKDREFEDLSARYVAALSEVGGLGIAMDAVRSAGARRGLEFIAGPSLSEMARTAEVLASDKDTEEKLEALGKLAKKQIPFGSVVFDRGN